MVELDGGQYAEQFDADKVRTAALEAAGFIILRFWNNDIEFRMDMVLDTIVLTALTARNEPID